MSRGLSLSSPAFVARVTPSVPAFVGAWDDYIASTSGGWSLGQRVSSDYTGPLFRVRRSSDDAELDMGYDGDGLLDEVALLAFTGAGDGLVHKVYYQVNGGTNHLIQDTPGNQPAIVLAGVVQKKNNAPIMTGVNKFVTSTNTVTGAFTLYASARNGQAKIQNFGTVMAIVPSAEPPLLSIMDADVGNPWCVPDDDYNFTSLVGLQTTWSALVINSPGTGAANSTKFRCDDTAVSKNSQVAAGGVVQFGSADMKLEFAEGAIFPVSHLSGTMDAFQAILRGFIAPALAALMVAAVDGAIAGENPATAQTLYSTLNHATATYVRDTGCFGSGFVSALTAISPWNSNAVERFNGTLISPRHMLFATHDAVPVTNDTVRFVKTDGTVVTRTIEDIEVITDVATNFPDMRVALLDSDVPAGIDFARVLPVNFTTALVLSLYDYIPCLGVNQYQQLTVFNITKLPAVKTASLRMEWDQPALGSERDDFHIPFIGGDSSCPLFTILDNKLVLLALATSTIAGTHVAPWHTDINAAMSTLGGGYTLTDADLSSYGTY